MLLSRSATYVRLHRPEAMPCCSSSGRVAGVIGRFPSHAMHQHRRRVHAHGILDFWRKGQASNEASTAVQDPDMPPCSTECVQEVFNLRQFRRLLETITPETLVVVDFYKTSCGACKYIQPGFVKLCKSTEDERPLIHFVKHNVMNDEEELTDLAQELNVKVVPMFVFFRKGEEIERFPTREKSKIAEAINKNTHNGMVQI